MPCTVHVDVTHNRHCTQPPRLSNKQQHTQPGHANLSPSTNQPITHLCVAALGQLLLVRFPAGHVDGDRVEQDADVGYRVRRKTRLEECLDRPCAGELEGNSVEGMGREEERQTDRQVRMQHLKILYGTVVYAAGAKTLTQERGGGAAHCRRKYRNARA